MPRKTLKQWLPTPTRIRKIEALHVLGDWIYQTNLWHINRYSASMAFFVGIFVAFLPIPGQMLAAAILAVLLRCNLPLSVALVWITNPVTMPAIFYLSYRVGALLIDVPVQVAEFEMTVAWISARIGMLWQPLLLGSLLCGLLFGSLGYTAVNLFWRWHVSRQWRRRKQHRARHGLLRRRVQQTDATPAPGEE
ncbi:DUF2062 domain-containing protein [Haliea sp. E1-2-M8]|uniref:DUF2062 domain-containing protein n=1 Tax=Haliea sp. E1-2-M8 TaxID=3064706 RepID=UPI0027239C5F|nr:DUF2062 domain-containing protein [Haliea sp. E1-2-M8]MDO8862394.1 DUF2062 domain-containing protein [Haliea sp. E1-2-M8]